MINGILWKLRTGAPWRDMPERYGPRSTCADRRRAGAQRAMDPFARRCRPRAMRWAVVSEVSIDSTTVRAHQHAAGEKGAAMRRSAGAGRADDEGASDVRRQGARSRSAHAGSGTIVRSWSRCWTRSGCRVRDGATAQAAQPGRSPTRHDPVLPPDIALGITAVIPAAAGPARTAGREGGRPLAFDRGAYRRRNVVERCMNRLKQWRSVATRYERVMNYRAMVVIAALMRAVDSSDTP